MSEITVCEGVWRNRVGQRLVITQCKPDDDWQQWTDGEQRYSDNGSFYVRYGGCSEQDLIEYIGPRPELNQTAEIERLRAEWQQAQRCVSNANEAINAKSAEIDRLKAEAEKAWAGWSDANSALVQQTAEVHRLKTEWQQSEAVRRELAAEIERLNAEWTSEFTAAQQLRSEVEQLRQMLDHAREESQEWRANSKELEHHCEGMKAAFLGTIKTLWKERR